MQHTSTCVAVSTHEIPEDNTNTHLLPNLQRQSPMDVCDTAAEDAPKTT